MVNDGQIIELLKAGKREGMNVLFERYYKPLVLFADGMLHDLSAAEDVVQEQLSCGKRLFTNGFTSGR